AGSVDTVHPAFGVAAGVDAGRAEPGSHGERGHRVTRLVPCRGDGGPPGLAVVGKAPAVVAPPDPQVVHDGLVVVADEAAQFGPDRGQRPLLGGRAGPPRTDGRAPRPAVGAAHLPAVTVMIGILAEATPSAAHRELPVGGSPGATRRRFTGSYPVGGSPEAAGLDASAPIS